jgi:DNA-binding transcriptional ArsR family regulator
VTGKKLSTRPKIPRRETYTLENLDQIKVLADPLRIRILEAFCAERTTKQVAELLGEKPTKLYHHVDALEKVGLIALSRTRPNRGTVEKYYLAVARTFRTDSSVLQSKGRRGGGKNAAMRRMMSTIFDTTAAEIASLLDRGAGAGDVIAAEGIVSFLEIHASQAELEEIRGRLHALVQTLGEVGEGATQPATGRDESADRKRYRLTLAYYPLDPIVPLDPLERTAKPRPRKR